MARKRYSAEQIIKKLREAEVLQAQGQTVEQALDNAILKEAANPNF